MIVYTTATVDYICYLNDKDEKKVRDYAESTNCSFITAVAELYDKGEIDLYNESREGDFDAESIGGVEE